MNGGKSPLTCLNQGFKRWETCKVYVKKIAICFKTQCLVFHTLRQLYFLW